MTMARTEQWQRGRILQVLSDNGALGSAMSFGLLLRTLDTLGVSLSARELGRPLDYLAGKEYTTLQRRKDIPGYDRQRAKIGAGRPSDIIAVKLTPKGQDLVDRNIPADPGIDFE
jgi:hypothetical protein